MNYIQLFAQSTLIELLVLLVIFRKHPVKRVLVFGVLANALTHPLVVFGFLAMPPANLLVMLVWGELFAIIAEAVIYFYGLRVSAGRAIAASLIANLASWQLGPILSWMLRGYYPGGGG